MAGLQFCLSGLTTFTFDNLIEIEKAKLYKRFLHFPSCYHRIKLDIQGRRIAGIYYCHFANYSLVLSEFFFFFLYKHPKMAAVKSFC